MPRLRNSLLGWMALALCAAGCTSVPPVEESTIVTETQIIYVEPDTCIECVIEDVLSNFLADRFPPTPDTTSGPTPDAAGADTSTPPPPDAEGPPDADDPADVDASPPPPDTTQPPADTGGPVVPPDTGGSEVPPLTIDLNINAPSLSGLVTIEPVVTGGDVVLGVEFYVDGMTLHTDFIPPYSFLINTATYADGPHTITVYTADNTGQQDADETIITFDNSPPVFTKTIPAEGVALFFEDRPLTMELVTDDDSSIDLVRLRANGFMVGEFFNPPFLVQKSWDEVYVTEDTLPASVNVRFYARDQLGLQTDINYNVWVHKRFAWKFENLGQIWSPAQAFANGNIAFATATSDNSGRVVVVNPAGEPVWDYDIGSNGAVRTPIAYDPNNDRVLVSTLVGNVLAFNSGGGLAWENNLTYPLASLAMYGSQVYALTIYGEIRVINTSNGTNAWSVGSITSASVFSRLSVDDNGRAYFGDASGEFFCVTQDGVQWSKQTGGKVEGRPIIAPDGVVYFGSADGFLYALNSDGTDLWKTDVNGELGCDMHRDPETGDIFVLTGIKDMTRVAAGVPNCEDPAPGACGGQELWTVPLEGWVQSTGIEAGPDGTLYVAGALGRVYAVDPETGAVLWSYQLATESADVKDEQFYASPFVHGGKLYIGNENTFFYALTIEAPIIEVVE